MNFRNREITIFNVNVGNDNDLINEIRNIEDSNSALVIEEILFIDDEQDYYGLKIYNYKIICSE